MAGTATDVEHDPTRDGTYLESGDDNFNNPANWSGGFVPTGTATISVGVRPGNQPIRFTAEVTRLGAIKLTGATQLVLATDKSVEFTDDGLEVAGLGLAVIDGTLRGPVVTRGKLGGGRVWGKGNLLGQVVNESELYPGGGLSEQYEVGELTIDLGSYTQINASLIVAVRRVGGTIKLSHLHIRGRATLAQFETVAFVGETASLPNLTLPFLTTTQGLLGRFERTIGPGKVTYDAKVAYVEF